MTDSIKISLDLSNMPIASRVCVPVQITTVSDLFEQFISRYLRPTIQFSPLSRTKTKWLVRCEKIGEHDVPSRIEADLNLPNALKGQNLEHGTSVFAAGYAALYLLKIWMAAQGVPQASLDTLSIHDVLLRGVTITYLIQCASPEEAEALVHDIRTTAHILDDRTESWKSRNETVKLLYKGASVGAYYKTLLKHCKWPDGCPKVEIIGANKCLVRLESMLSGAFLKKHGLTALTSWETAYQDGLYEEIFNKTVVEALRLDLRHNLPRPEVRRTLTATQREFLDWYLEGSDTRQFRNIVESKYPSDAYSKLRKAIYEQCKIETDISWVKHQELRCFKLKDVLVYPGDYHPPTERAPWCFCQESWPALLSELEGVYQEALAKEEELDRLAQPLEGQAMVVNTDCPVPLASPVEDVQPAAEGDWRDAKSPGEFARLFEVAIPRTEPRGAAYRRAGVDDRRPDR